MLATSLTVFKRGSKRVRRFVIIKEFGLSNDDRKRVPSVVAECLIGRSEILRTTWKRSRLRSLEPSPERFAFWWANETRCVS